MASNEHLSEPNIKEAVSVAEMSRLLGLSRARFYQLVRDGVFLPPLQDPRTRRPYFTADLQRTNMEIKRNNRGANGQVILFYAARKSVPPPSATAVPKPARVKRQNHDDLLSVLRQLGLREVTAAEVAGAVKTLYPSGVGETQEGDVVRAVLRHLRRSARQNTSDNEGR